MSFGQHLCIGLMAGVMAFATGCTEPEISKVLKDYCDFKIDSCHGGLKYQTKQECEKYHKDLLNRTADGNAAACRGNIEDFFIALMENQMASGCDRLLIESVLDTSDENMQTALEDGLKCFEEHDVKIDIKSFINGI